MSSSSSSKGSFPQNTFQKYPAVLVAAEGNHSNNNEGSFIPPPFPLELRDLPKDPIWAPLDTKYGIDESIREQASPFGGTFGDIVDMTSRKMISTVVVEERFYHTWHFGRTVLIGDGK